MEENPIPIKLSQKFKFCVFDVKIVPFDLFLKQRWGGGAGGGGRGGAGGSHGDISTDITGCDSYMSRGLSTNAGFIGVS